MAQTAVTTSTTPPPIRRRALFGLFDADGWGWASTKALFWFFLIIIVLGYIPDRAYYFTVQKTVDIGLLAWSPINLCPPENETLPCPAPAGATLPWQPGPSQASLPAARTDGGVDIIGQVFLYVGGSDGSAAAGDTYVNHQSHGDNIDLWSVGPALPEARTAAATVVLGNTLYVIGGDGPDGKPTSTVFSLTVDNDGTLGEWKTEDSLVLPEARAGASAVAVSDGIVVMGGTNGTAATDTVWKSQQDTSGALQAWAPQTPLAEPNTDGAAVHDGDYVYVMGGRNAAGDIVATVQRGRVGGSQATEQDPNAIIDPWATSAQTNLPGPRTNVAAFVANGSVHVVGGSDPSGPRPEQWWVTPDSQGALVGWQHLDATDLGIGLDGSGAVVSGSHAFLFGGTTPAGVTGGAARTDLAPQPPFFQLGILGATIPALKLDGEIGQQIGYLNAAGVATVNFVLLLLVGWGFAHKERVREIVAARRRRRG